MKWQEWADDELADIQLVDNTIRESVQAEKEILAITGRLCTRITELEKALKDIINDAGNGGITIYVVSWEVIHAARRILGDEGEV